MESITHKKDMPFGWLNRDGRNLPAFICSKTGHPISPQNPGTLYWNPESGKMVVLSQTAEDQFVKPDSKHFPCTTELDVHSLDLFQNTAGPDGSESQRIAHEKSASLSRI